MVGSRAAERAAETAAELAEATGGDVRGLANEDAAAAGDVVVVAVPYDGHADLLRSLAGDLAGKVVVDCVNPLGFDQQGAYALAVHDGSAAQEAAALLTGLDRGRGVPPRQRRAARRPRRSPRSTPTSWCSARRHRDATDLVGLLADAIPGMRGVYAGRLRNAHQVEALTANLISVNRRYKAHAGCASPTSETDVSTDDKEADRRTLCDRLPVGRPAAGQGHSQLSLRTFRWRRRTPVGCVPVGRVDPVLDQVAGLGLDHGGVHGRCSLRCRVVWWWSDLRSATMSPLTVRAWSSMWSWPSCGAPTLSMLERTEPVTVLMSAQTGVPAGMPMRTSLLAPLALTRPRRAVPTVRSPLPVDSETSALAVTTFRSPEPVLTTVRALVVPTSTSPEPVETFSSLTQVPTETSPEPLLTWSSAWASETSMSPEPVSIERGAGEGVAGDVARAGLDPDLVDLALDLDVGAAGLDRDVAVGRQGRPRRRGRGRGRRTSCRRAWGR